HMIVVDEHQPLRSRVERPTGDRVPSVDPVGPQPPPQRSIQGDVPGEFGQRSPEQAVPGIVIRDHADHTAHVGAPSGMTSMSIAPVMMMVRSMIPKSASP